MTNKIVYSTQFKKSYTAKIEFDSDDNILFGNIIGIRDTVCFHGESVAELKDAFHEAVDFYLESCRKAGRIPDKPFSGKFMVRLDPVLYAEVAIAAARGDKSLNAWVSQTLDEAIQNSHR